MKFVRCHHALWILILAAAFDGCKSHSFDERTENLNKGSITIVSDESYRYVVKELVTSYENVYPESKIIITYGSDRTIFDAMLKDKARMMITGRELSEEDIAAIEVVNGIRPEIIPIATEAVAVITASTSSDTIFDLDEFQRSRNAGYTGRYRDTKFVFNKENESIISKLLGTSTGNLNNLFSLENIDTLTKYLSATKNAFGFISFAEISDMDDPGMKQILSNMHVANIAKTDSTGTRVIYELSQSSIAAKKYPLQRKMTIVVGNIPELLGTGFVNFMYRSKASRIFLKSGLVPEKMPERQIKIVE